MGKLEAVYGPMIMYYVSMAGSLALGTVIGLVTACAGHPWIAAGVFIGIPATVHTLFCLS